MGTVADKAFCLRNSFNRGCLPLRCEDKGDSTERKDSSSKQEQEPQKQRQPQSDLSNGGLSDLWGEVDIPLLQVCQLCASTYLSLQYEL